MRSKIADKLWGFVFILFFQISSFSKEKKTIEPNILVMRWNFIIQYTVQFSLSIALYFSLAFISLDSAIVLRARYSAIDRLHNDRREEEKKRANTSKIYQYEIWIIVLYNWEWSKATHHEYECLRVCLCIEGPTSHNDRWFPTIETEISSSIWCDLTGALTVFYTQIFILEQTDSYPIRLNRI